MQVQWVEQFGIQREVTQYPWQVMELTLGLQIRSWSLTPATTSNESKTWKSHSFVCYLSSNLLHFSSKNSLSLSYDAFDELQIATELFVFFKLTCTACSPISLTDNIDQSCFVLRIPYNR
jgi:hypothetical protein